MKHLPPTATQPDIVVVEEEVRTESNTVVKVEEKREPRRQLQSGVFCAYVLTLHVSPGIEELP